MKNADEKTHITVHDFSEVFTSAEDTLINIAKKYAVGIIGLSNNHTSPFRGNIASGTLVSTQNCCGILTACHVIENIIDGSDKFGLVLSFKDQYESYTINVPQVKTIRLGSPTEGKIPEHPDLAFILFSKQIEVDLLTKEKSFYNLDTLKEKILDNLDLYRDIQREESLMVHWGWCAIGTPDEKIEVKKDVTGFSHVQHGECTIAGISSYEKIHISTNGNGYDAIIFELKCTGPNHLNSCRGMSGGGIWQFLPQYKDNVISTNEVLFTGVICETTLNKKSIIQITCHGHESIYRLLLEAVKAHLSHSPQVP